MSTNYGWQDQSQVEYPPLYEESSSSSVPDRNLGNFDPEDINYRTYTDRSRPILVRLQTHSRGHSLFLHDSNDDGTLSLPQE